MATARDTFIRPSLFKDRNFAIGSIFSMMIGVVAFATIPMIVVMTQSLLGYSALQAGFISLPRAIGTLTSMLIVSRALKYVDTRAVIVIGLVLMGSGMLMYSHVDLYVDQRTLVFAGLVQGLGSGMIFVPLSVIVFSTLDPALRNEGAAIFALTRNVGNAVGISAIQYEYLHFIAQSRNDLVQHVRPDNPVFAWARPDFDFGSQQSMAAIYGEVSRQATMVGDVTLFHVVFLLTLCLIPLVMLMRVRKTQVDTHSLPIGE